MHILYWYYKGKGRGTSCLYPWTCALSDLLQWSPRFHRFPTRCLCRWHNHQSVVNWGNIWLVTVLLLKYSDTTATSLFLFSDCQPTELPPNLLPPGKLESPCNHLRSSGVVALLGVKWLWKMWVGCKDLEASTMYWLLACLLLFRLIYKCNEILLSIHKKVHVKSQERTCE